MQIDVFIVDDTVLYFNEDFQFLKRVYMVIPFLKSDYVYDFERNKIIRKNAVPLPVHHVFDPSQSCR